MDQQKIARINELYRKSKAEGLTEAEKKEQKILRIDGVSRRLRVMYMYWICIIIGSIY